MLEVPLTLQWKRGRKMITGMTFYPQAVVLKGRVYIGGGSTNDQDAVVTYYDIERNQWSALPLYSERFFAMTMIREELVLIGGRNLHMPTKTSTKIVIWSESIQGFAVKRPPMGVLLTACDAATAVAYDNRWLIVVGGRDDAYQSLSKVDIIDVTNHQSYHGAQLPQPAHKMTTAVIGNTLVLLGGTASHRYSNTNKVFGVKLDDLITQAVSFESVSISPWQTLPDTPVVSSTVLAFNGALLAVGGNKPCR